MPFTVWLALAVLSTAVALFFALANCALRSFSRARLEAALRARGRLGELGRLYRHRDDLLQMARALHIVSVVACTVLAEAWAIDRFGTGATGWLIGGAAAAAVGVIVTGVVPLAWAKYAAESVLVVALPLCQLCRAVLAPAWRVLRVFDIVVQRLAGATDEPQTFSHIEEEIRSVAGEGEREGVFAEGQKAMIDNVLKFPGAVASQVMAPRTDIVSIDAGATTEEARALVAQSGHSRIPVTRGHLDTVVGILYAKDLLDRSCGEGGDRLRVKDVMRTPLFVPETKRLDELLGDFQGDKVHMAIVLDEYGGTAGLVTIEDVIEEIVGEIVDEYEQAPPKSIRRLAPSSFEVEARVHIDEVNAELDLHLPEGEDYETIGGFVLSRLGYIPKTGESFQVAGLRITVAEADERKISRLRIDVPEPPQPPREP